MLIRYTFHVYIEYYLAIIVKSIEVSDARIGYQHPKLKLKCPKRNQKRPRTFSNENARNV